MAKLKILSISYDQSLLSTRQRILEQGGHEVTSALGFTKALQACQDGNFNLVIIGHSIPRSDADALIAATRERCDAAVLSLRRFADLPNPHAHYSIDAAEGPETLLQAVGLAVAAKAAERLKPFQHEALAPRPSESNKTESINLQSSPKLFIELQARIPKRKENNV